MTLPPPDVPALPSNVFFGCDLDVATAQGDLALAANLDLAVVVGDDVTAQEIFLRASDSPGALLFVFDWGAGAGAFVGQPITDAAPTLLADALATQAAQAQGVQAVQDVAVDGTTDVLQATVTVQTGNGPLVVPLTFSVFGTQLGSG